MQCDVSHVLGGIIVQEEISTTPPPPKPYAFSYAAGRHPGHVDRTHSEVSDGSGTVKGSFSYVDPRNQVRTVEYIADAHGFYPHLSHLQKSPQQTEAVERASQKHFALYAKIAAEHANPHYQHVVSIRGLQNLNSPVSDSNFLKRFATLLGSITAQRYSCSFQGQRSTFYAI